MFSSIDSLDKRKVPLY